MKKIYTILIFILTPFLLRSQVVFKTIVPLRPVVAGESFQVQYVFQEAGKITNFKAPPFAHFRFVSGPNQYNGSVTTIHGIRPNRNFVYTLEAIKPGRFMIPGAVATENGRAIKSNDVVLEVISKEKAAKLYDRNAADNSDYVLRPGEDPYEKIRQNLFLKVAVDRTNCFAGEPVLAIFKLYSRLESNSDIVKNPGFYGFTVYDMVNLSDKQMNTEMVNGKLFDVHTIRKMQLFPLQAGTFSIDAMEIKNKVEFSHSIVNKKTEQEIIEGMAGNNDEETKNENVEVYETSMHTEPVAIHVKTVPLKNKPASFNGAVGAFSISAGAVKNRIAKNEEGVFEITIRGNGNFTQLNAPAIDWPDGIEGFEPIIRDSLDKTQFPLAGSRTFRYTFICNRPGLYHLPPVNFSFFDPHNNTFKTVSTTAEDVEISNEEKKNTITTERKESIAGKNARASRIAAGIVILLVIIVLTYWILHKDKPVQVIKKEVATLPSVDEMLAPPGDLIHVSDKEFCSGLQQSIWKWLGVRLGLEGSTGNKEILFSKLKQRGVKDEMIANLQKLLTDCELGMFTGAALDINKDKMLKDAKQVLEDINLSLL
ncbi:MAG TPA: BatD family protein [Chitinophagaceae bacterium]|nr:BatD family protein [Chitinophagaceae bacterium]